MIPGHLERIATRFWDCAGGTPTIGTPRSLRHTIPLVCGLFLIQLENLTRAEVRNWFARRQVSLPPTESDTDCALFGCVVAFRGVGAIFTDSNLSAEMDRVILAHELAHFLVEYQWPRQRVLRRLGESVRPILDGERESNLPEEFAALLAGVRFGLHVHELSRETASTQTSTLPAAERTANQMALELLAPWQDWLPRAEDANLKDELIEKAGLPESWAIGYASTLKQYARRHRPFSRHWAMPS